MPSTEKKMKFKKKKRETIFKKKPSKARGLVRSFND